MSEQISSHNLSKVPVDDYAKSGWFKMKLFIIGNNSWPAIGAEICTELMFTGEC